MCVRVCVYVCLFVSVFLCVPVPLRVVVHNLHLDWEKYSGNTEY